MELVEGETLARKLAPQRPLAPRAAAAVIQAIASALEHTHGRGILHRDVKPENIIVSGDAHRVAARLIDFGLAIRIAKRRDERLTGSGSVVGTPQYLSPEQVFGRPLDASADIFALGLILYETLTGVLPFDGPAIEVARQNAFDTPPPMRERNPEAAIAPELETLVSRMLDRSPGCRPTAGQVVEALDQLARAGHLADAPERGGRSSWGNVGLVATLCSIPVVVALAALAA